MKQKLDEKRIEGLLKTVADYEEFLELCGDTESGMPETVPMGAAPNYRNFIQLLQKKEKTSENQ